MSERGGAVTQRLASSMDLAGTVLDRAGITSPWGMQGRSLLPVLRDDTPVRDAVLVEEEQQRLCFGFDKPPRVHSLVTSRGRLSVYRDVAFGELYDPQQDPRKRINRWDDRATEGRGPGAVPNGAGLSSIRKAGKQRTWRWRDAGPAARTAP